MREQVVVDRGTRKKSVRLVPPVTTGHADYVNPFEFTQFLGACEGLDFDVMLEAKAKDLALFRLRSDLERYAPWCAGRFGLGPGAVVRDAAEDGAEGRALSGFPAKA